MAVHGKDFRFGRPCSNSTNLGNSLPFPLTDEHLPRLQQLLEQYQSLPMDLADASLVLLAEHLGHGRIVSTDERDFQTYRWKQHYTFTNLLLP